MAAIAVGVPYRAGGTNGRLRLVTRVLLLDLDETLVDRTAVVHAWAEQMAQEYEDPSLCRWLVEYDHDGSAVRDRSQFLAGVADRLGWTDTVETLLQWWPTAFGTRFRLADELKDSLQRARNAGCRLAVVSNGDAIRQRVKVDAMGLEDAVDAVLISGELGVRKPEAEIFTLAAEAVGATLDDAWMIGDDPTADIDGGWSIGARPIWVNRHGKPWPVGLRRPVLQCSGPAEAVDFAVAHR